MQQKYDAIVVGSGTAGQTAAYIIKDSGMSVALVDNAEEPGGVCALAGCQAKKWFYEAAELVGRSRHLSGKGISQVAKANWGDITAEKEKFTSRVPENTIDGFKGAGIDFIQGTASFSDEKSLVLDGRKNLSADFIVLATGAHPMPLPFKGAEYMIKNDDFLKLNDIPAKVIFVGGGFISFEFAHFAARLGEDQTRCTILEAALRPLGPFDSQMVELLVDNSQKENIDIICGVEIESISKSKNGFEVKTADKKIFEADLVVHGAGRVPNLKSLELEKAGIEFTRRGIVVTDELATTNANVYAVGDCAATIQLARVADYEAHVAAENIKARFKNSSNRRNIDYSSVPSVLFTYPQYAMVGATEDELKEKNVSYRKRFAKNLSWPTYRRVGLKGAAYKVLVDADGKLLGAHVLSDNATGLINTFCMAMRMQISVKELYRQSIMTPYPSRESDIIYMLSEF